MSVSDEYGCVNQIRFQGRSFAGEDISNYKIVDTGDIVYTRSPLKSKPYGIIKIVGAETGIVSPLYIVNKVKVGNDSEYIYRVFDSPEKTNTYLSPLVRKGAKNTMNISNDEWLSGEIIVAPSFDEQHKIGEYFKRLDNLITLHQCKCIFENYYFVSWEQRKFEEFAQRQSSTMVSDSENPCVEYEDVISEQGELNKDIYSKDTEKNGIYFTEDDILYGKLRPYLHNWLNPDFNGVAVGDWWVLRPINMDKNFLYWLIQTPQYDNAANQSSGTKMPRADWKLVSNTEFYIPGSVDEQAQIARLFANLNNFITLHQRPTSDIDNIHFHDCLLVKVIVFAFEGFSLNDILNKVKMERGDLSSIGWVNFLKVMII